MATDISNENIKIDFRYFITSTLQNKITWEFLNNFLNDMTPNLATSKQVIKVLLKELQNLQFELKKIQSERTINEVTVLHNFQGNKADFPENSEDHGEQSVPENLKPLEHRDKYLKCQNCSKSYASKSKLNRHTLVHSAENLYSCRICTKPCSSYSDLEKHEIIHTGEKTF